MQNQFFSTDAADDPPFPRLSVGEVSAVGHLDDLLPWPQLASLGLSSSAHTARIRGNTIFSNGSLGIDLGGLGLQPNDACDPDTGANGLQNYPVLTSVTQSGPGTLVASASRATPRATSPRISRARARVRCGLNSRFSGW